MTDPQRRQQDHPRRAEPLQPDRPGHGHKTEDDGQAPPDAFRKARQQEDAAVDNAREGYD